MHPRRRDPDPSPGQRGDSVVVERPDRRQIGPASREERLVAGIFVVRDGRLTVGRDDFDLATPLGQGPGLPPP